MLRASFVIRASDFRAKTPRWPLSRFAGYNGTVQERGYTQMATSQEKVHGHDYVDFDEYIDIQLKKTGSTIKMTDVLTAVVGILTLITLYLLLFVIFDHWVITGGFGPATRGIMLAVVGTASCAWFVWKVIVPWRRRVSVLYAASTIEKASPAQEQPAQPGRHHAKRA